jgi:RHO1 GDP-GTP exchange protein 1/2
MDLYDEKRTLVHSGVLARRQRSETDWHGWNDYFIALLDNYRECMP